MHWFSFFNEIDNCPDCQNIAVCAKLRSLIDILCNQASVLHHSRGPEYSIESNSLLVAVSTCRPCSDRESSCSVYNQINWPPLRSCSPEFGTTLSFTFHRLLPSKYVTVVNTESISPLLAPTCRSPARHNFRRSLSVFARRNYRLFLLSSIAPYVLEIRAIFTDASNTA